MVDKKALRKKIFVDREFQASFILKILVILLAIVVLISILIIYSTSQKISGSVYTKIVQLKNTKEIILPLVIKIGVLILLVFGGLVGYNLLKYTHKIVGPLVRFKRCLKKMGNLDFTEHITFRKKDKLRDLGEVLGSTANKLNRTMKTIKEHSDVISMSIKEKGIKKLNDKEIKLLKDSVDTIEFILKNCKTD